MFKVYRAKAASVIRMYLKEKRMLIFSLIVVLGVSLFWCFEKKGMFLDEVYSYGLSNSADFPFVTRMYDDGIVNKVISSKDLFGYVSVEFDERFDYASVYYNQTQDVHPPLFYFLLHTVCSLFPGEFSKWFGLGINLVILLFIYAFLYKLSCMFMRGGHLPALVCLIYGLSKGALSNLLMIRMYMLLTLMTLILAYLVARFIEQKYTGFYPALFAVIYAGMFTQYFYVVFAFFFCAIFVIYLLLQREIKEFLVSSLFAIAGVGTTLLTFPYVGQQLTSQTTVSLNTVAENAKAGWGVYVERVLNFTYQMITNMPIVAIIAVLSFAGIIVMVMIDRKKLKKMFENSHNFWLIVIASILSFIMIAIIAPYAAIRYVYHLMPLFALIVMVIAQNVSVILRDSMKRKVCWMMAVIGSFLFMSLFEPNYLYTEYAEIDAILAEHANELCVYISSNNNPSITSDIGHLILFDDICIIDEELFALDDYVEKKLSDSMVVFISQYPNARDDQGILEDLKKRYDFSDISKIASENFSNIYIIEK